jgi:magnesium-transporting ATPase (P-type)
MTKILARLPFIGDWFDDEDYDDSTDDTEANKASAYTDEQTIPLSELEQRLKTNLKTGLSSEEAAARFAQNGPNALTPPKRAPEWVKFLRTMFSGFASLLWIAGILCLIAYGMETASADYEVPPDNLYIAGALIVVVFLTGIFTYYQQRKSGKIMESFAKMIPPSAKVLRNGKTEAIEARFLVVGDVVNINGGDKVPADLRIFVASSLEVRPDLFTFTAYDLWWIPILVVLLHKFI